MNDFPKPTQLSTIYTAKEAAGRLKMTQRGVITIGKRYGCCSINGRNALFSEQDLLDIWQIMRAPATATKRVTASAIAFYTSDASYKDLLRTDQRKRDEKRRLRMQRETAERERRLEVKRQTSRDKVAARVAKRTAALDVKAAQHAAADSEDLDVNNRDPAYWTDQRKKRLRLERLARLNGDAGQ